MDMETDDNPAAHLLANRDSHNLRVIELCRAV